LVVERGSKPAAVLAKSLLLATSLEFRNTHQLQLAISVFVTSQTLSADGIILSQICQAAAFSKLFSTFETVRARTALVESKGSQAVAY